MCECVPCCRCSRHATHSCANIRCAGGILVDKSFYHRKIRTLHHYRRIIILRTLVRMYNIPTCRNGKWREERPCIYIICMKKAEPHFTHLSTYIQYCLDMNCTKYPIPLAVAANGSINMAAYFRCHGCKMRDRYEAMHRLPIPWLRCYSCRYLNL